MITCMRRRLTRWKHRHLPHALLVALSLAGAGCGSDDPGGQSGATPGLPGSSATTQAALLGGIQEAKLTAASGSDSDEFGISVAFDGDTAVVGAARIHSNHLGAAYVFGLSDGNWHEQQVLNPSVAFEFGRSVAISGDTVVVGAPIDASTTNTGAAYVYVRSNGQWVVQTTLHGDDASIYPQFGQAVAIDGDTVLVGVPYNIFGATPHPGAAYVFRRNGDTWTAGFKLTPSDGAAGDHFGASVALTGDTALVGAPALGSDVLEHSGSAYVFQRTADGWTQQAKLTAGDASANAWFGTSVAIEGNTALVGSDGRGAYEFQRHGDAWNQQAKLAAGAFDGAGQSVAIAGDTALLGAPRYTEGGLPTFMGAVFVFQRDGSVWGDPVKLVADDPMAYAALGSSVAIFGETVLAGAPTSGGVRLPGAVYVFRLQFGPDEIAAALDIKPGSDTNPVNLRSRGVIPVAILGGTDLDVTTVDVSTLAFGPGEATPVHAAGGHLEDVNDDGHTDLVSHYSTQAAGLAAEATQACVTGRTSDGTPLRGCDGVTIVP